VIIYADLKADDKRVIRKTLLGWSGVLKKGGWKSHTYINGKPCVIHYRAFQAITMFACGRVNKQDWRSMSKEDWDRAFEAIQTIYNEGAESALPVEQESADLGSVVLAEAVRRHFATTF
jgi:hypothetical protein